VRAKIEQEGSFTVPGKTLSEIVGLSASTQFEFTLKDSEILLKGNEESVVKIKGVSAEEYPIIPKVESQNSVEVSGKQLKDALSRVVFAVANNEIRPELSGVLFNVVPEEKKFVFAATDSFRLAEKKVEIKDQNNLKPVRTIIPARAVYEIVRLLGVGQTGENEQGKFLFADNQLGFEYNGIHLVTRCIEGRYPDYTQIISKEFAITVACPKEVIMKEIKAAGIFTTSGMSAVNLALNEEQKNISIASSSAQVGEYASSIEAEVKGKSATIVLNYRYFLDGLNNVTGEKLHMGTNGNDSPCVLKGDEKDEYLYIVMPIKQ
jgi:DNA polymerase-3 subunit beta